MTLTATSPTANWAYLERELGVLKQYLARDLRRHHARSAARQVDQLQGFVVTEADVLAILSDDRPLPTSPSGAERGLEGFDADCGRQDAAHDGHAWVAPVHLAATFNLTPLEMRCLLLCLAAELDPRLGKVFAFLQDDATCRAPSIGLALRLFTDGGDASIAARSIFHPMAPLLAHRLLHVGEGAATDPLTCRALRLDDRISSYMLGLADVDERLAGWTECLPPADAVVRTPVPDDVRRSASDLVDAAHAGGNARCRPILHFYGRPGSGRRSLAEHLAQRLALPLLVADARRVPGGATERADLLWRLGRESLLQPAAILVEHFDDLLTAERAEELSAFLEGALTFAPATFLSGTAPWRGVHALRRRLFLSVSCPIPTIAARVDLWNEHLAAVPTEARPDEIAELATKFDLTDGQIERAVGLALSRTVWAVGGDGKVRPPELARACRTLATPNLRDLAQQVHPVYDWTDIVLPENQMGQMRELVAHVKRARTVLDEWGFAGKLPYGRGVGALFEGGSGTGKTMAAQIVAGELDLDLFKIDLSAVVSKYIGETEKNLSRVFAEAQSANAILFFDEADALFAKRSELAKGDAHDRYANMETAYLLQRIEEYHGVVILATNFKQNLDEAFIRRLRFIIHFPFPDEQHRLRIWTHVFPPAAPLAADVDFHWLAKKLKVAGGHIRSISVRAAYLAAERRSAIDLRCIQEAGRRELEKFGRTWHLPESRAHGTANEPATSAEAVA